MSGGAGDYRDAEDVRWRNRSLDIRINELIDALDVARLTELEPTAPGEEAWSAAIVLAHLGEFPRFFAGELRRFLADPGAPIGRTHEHPERLAAVADAQGRSLDQLYTAVRTAQDELAGALVGLEDAHLTATTQNRKYGPEPLTAFLDRYVIGHKAGHLDQLAGMPAAPEGNG